MNCVKNNIDFSKDIIIKSQEILASLAQLLPDDKNIKKQIGIVQYWLDTIDSKIIIPLIGNKSTGKTSIINSFIGKELLPLGSMTTTKAFLIGHHNNNTIIINKANLVQNQLYAYFKEEVIGRKEFDSTEEAKKYIKDIYSIKSSFEDSFYYIYLNLKRLQEIGIPEEHLKQILFLDLPGLDMEGDNDNKPLFTFDSLTNLFNIVDSFLFINENNIDDNATEKLKTKLKDQILLRRKTFNIPINHSLFVLNQSNDEEDSGDTFEQNKQKIERELNSEIAKVVRYSTKKFDKDFKEKDKLSLLTIMNDCLSEIQQLNNSSPTHIKLKAARKHCRNKQSFISFLHKNLNNQLLLRSIKLNNESKINESDRQTLNSFIEENKIEYKSDEEEIKNKCLQIYNELYISSKDTKISPPNDLFFKELNSIIASLNSEKQKAVKTQSDESLNKIQMLIEYIENIQNTRIKQDQEKISTSKERINQFFTNFYNEVNVEFKKYRHLIEKQFIIESTNKEELKEYLTRLNNSIKDVIQEYITRLSEQITRLLEQLYQNINNELIKYSIKLQNENNNQLNDTIPQFNNSVYDTLTSKSHFIIHGCWGGVHLGGTAVFAGVSLPMAFPVSLAILGGGLLIHVIIALVATIKDLVSFTKTVQKHLTQYQKEVLDNFDTFKETSMNILKENCDSLKEQIDREFRQFDESKKFSSQEQFKKFEQIKKDFINYKMTLHN